MSDVLHILISALKGPALGLGVCGLGLKALVLALTLRFWPSLRHWSAFWLIDYDNDYNLPTSMPKSPRMVPGFDFNGSVAPSIWRPTSTIFLPSHTYNEINNSYHLIQVNHIYHLSTPLPNTHDPLGVDYMAKTAEYITRSSAVAKRPCDASCLYSFYTLKWCGYPIVRNIQTYVYSFWNDPRTWKNCLPFSRTTAHIFVFPGDAPATITQYVARMERQSMLAKPLAACTYLSSIVSELYDA